MNKYFIYRYVAYKKYLIFLPFLLLFIFILARNFGLYPSVVDEYYYNKFSRLLPFNLLPVPIYLYSLIFKGTDLCRVGWLECVRLLNLIFYFSAAPFIYFISRRFTGQNLSAFIVFMSLAGVSNSYTAYFMPEAIYFFTFWALVWTLIDVNNFYKISRLCIVGIVIGLLSLIKPHGLFLLVPILVYGIFNCYLNNRKYIVSIIKIFLFLIISCLATKFIIGFLLAGKAGITFFGGFYSDHAVQITPSVQLYEVIKFFFFQYSAHLGFLILLFSTPIANGLINYKNNKYTTNYIFFTIIFIGFLIAVSAAYTTAINFQAGIAQGLRLHLRYYSFALPLLLMMGSIVNDLKAKAFSNRLRLIVFLIFTFISCYFIATKFYPFTPNYVDGPEIRGFTTNILFFYLLSFLSLLSLIVWYFNSKKGLLLYFIIFLPSYILVSNYFISNELRNRMFPSPFDNGAFLVKSILNQEQIGRLMIVGAPETAGILDLSMIYYDNVNVITKTIPENSDLNASNIPKNIEWILYIGKYNLGINSIVNIDGPYFKLIKIDSAK